MIKATRRSAAMMAGWGATLALGLALGLTIGGCAVSVEQFDPGGTSSGDAVAVAAPGPGQASPNSSQAARPLSTRHLVLNVQPGGSVAGNSEWAQFREEWNTAMREAAGAAGIPFTFQAGAPKATGREGTLVVLRINDYRWVSAGARWSLGVFTGNAYINADAQYLDLRNGSKLSARRFNTSSSAGQGIFSPVTDKQIRAICAEIVNQLKRP